MIVLLHEGERKGLLIALKLWFRDESVVCHSETFAKGCTRIDKISYLSQSELTGVVTTVAYGSILAKHLHTSGVTPSRGTSPTHLHRASRDFGRRCLMPNSSSAPRLEAILYVQQDRPIQSHSLPTLVKLGIQIKGGMEARGASGE
jgi:hypothetical protein